MTTILSESVKKSISASLPPAPAPEENIIEKNKKLFSAAVDFWRSVQNGIKVDCYDPAAAEVNKSFTRDPARYLKTQLSQNNAVTLPPEFFTGSGTLQQKYFFQQAYFGTIPAPEYWLYFIADPPFECKYPVYRYNTAQKWGTGYFVLIDRTLYPVCDQGTPVTYPVPNRGIEPEGYHARTARLAAEAAEAEKRRKLEEEQALQREIEKRAEQMMREEYRRRAAEQIKAECEQNEQ